MEEPRPGIKTVPAKRRHEESDLVRTNGDATSTNMSFNVKIQKREEQALWTGSKKNVQKTLIKSKFHQNEEEENSEPLIASAVSRTVLQRGMYSLTRFLLFSNCLEYTFISNISSGNCCLLQTCTWNFRLTRPMKQDRRDHLPFQDLSLSTSSQFHQMQIWSLARLFKQRS